MRSCFHSELSWAGRQVPWLLAPGVGVGSGPSSWRERLRAWTSPAVAPPALRSCSQQNPWVEGQQAQGIFQGLVCTHTPGQPVWELNLGLFPHVPLISQMPRPLSTCVEDEDNCQRPLLTWEFGPIGH